MPVFASVDPHVVPLLPHCFEDCIGPLGWLLFGFWWGCVGLEVELLPLLAPASMEELWSADECLFFEDLMELWWCFFF